jgi:hypothetical protein
VVVSCDGWCLGCSGDLRLVGEPVIIQWALAAIATLINHVFSVMPALPVPAWFTGAGVAIGNLFSAAGSMGVWIPVPLALNVMAVLFTSMFGGAIIKLARVILSLISGGGGGAA